MSRWGVAAPTYSALGTVLYEMATGQQAFGGSAFAAIFAALLKEAPKPLLQLNPAMPAELEGIISKALQKDRAVRYQSAAELLADLRRLKRDTDSGRASAVAGPAPPTSPGHGESIASPRPLGGEGVPRSGTGEGVQSRPQARRWLVAAALVVIAAAAGTYLYLRQHQSHRLTDQDTIVLADFTNKTGDAVFDDTLKQGLAVALRQSPFLNVLSDNQVDATLRLMERPAGTAVTGEVAREVCQRAGSRAYIAGSIAALGSQYVLGLKAVGCAGGETLAEEQATASGKEKVLNALGQEAARLRAELGESLASVQKFDTPLAQATTSSLEALKAYSVGLRVSDKPAAVLPYVQRAIQLDPGFATAYEGLGITYYNLGQTARARESITKAFALRERTSEREKLHITAFYYAMVTGELGKADQTFREWIESYPRDFIAYQDLSLDRMREGDYAASVELTRQLLRLDPSHAKVFYESLGMVLMPLGRPDEARKAFEEALSRKVDDDIVHFGFYSLAFLAGDTPGMASQAAWFEGKPDRPDLQHEILGTEADTEAYGGHLARARELTRQAVEEPCAPTTRTPPRHGV